MKKKRALRDDWTEEDVQFLSQFGIKADIGRMTIHIDEDERYFMIKKRYEYRWSYLSDYPYYEYSIEEIETADYFVLKDWYGCGYPQPDRNFKYESISFDSSKICQGCGCGRIQTNNLRVNKLSKHGFWGFSAWLFDEIFVSKNVYNEVFAPYGIEKRDVIKAGKKLEDVFQLIIPVIDEPIDLSDRKQEICTVCGETKYTMQHFAYPFFPLHNHPLPGIYKTKEYFGSGHEAQHVLIISKDIVNKLLKSKDLKKEWLIPCRKSSNDIPVALPHK